MPKHAVTNDEILDCFDVMVELRPYFQCNDSLEMVGAMKGKG